MKSVETENDGLKRAYRLTIVAMDIEARVADEVKRMAPKVRMPGFRPGKVPPNLIRKMHGEALRQDALSAAVQHGVQQLIAEKQLRPAMQPAVELDEGYEPGGDAEVHVRLETLPDIPEPALDALELERLTVEPDEQAVDQRLEELARSQKSWADAPEDHRAAVGDLVVVDFLGKVGDEPFEGGSGEDMSVEIGSGSLIPGFEDGLIGAVAGEERQIAVRFPDDYPAEHLKGRQASFDLKVKQLRTAGETRIDEDFAKSLGLTGLDQLRSLLRDQQMQELAGLTRTHMKRRLLDLLAERHDFPVPASMVESEFDNIMGQLRHEAGHEADPAAALAEIEADSGDYRAIAERRVRLGLLLSEIGRINGIEIAESEMRRLVEQAAQRYAPKDRQRFVEYVRGDAMAAAQLRAPLYEDKVVDFLFGRAAITDRSASREQLEADLESEVGHVHGPGCGHDHDQGHDHGAKAPAKSKGAATARAADKPADRDKGAAKPGTQTKAAPQPAKPLKGSVEPEPARPQPAEPVKDGPGAKPATKAAPAKKATGTAAPASNAAPAKKAGTSASKAPAGGAKEAASKAPANKPPANKPPANRPPARKSAAKK